MIRRIAVIVLLSALVALLSYRYLGRSHTACQICDRPIHAETYFRIQQVDGESEDVCCPRCAVRYLKNRPKIDRSLSVSDFKTQVLIPAQGAIYVEDSDVHPCSSEVSRREITGAEYEKVWDRCLPSLVAFQDRVDAEDFRRCHGGRLVSYSQLGEE
ncbi:MAG TPA: hypothetical protein VGQ81_06800 [Acidobacteriota bacterium]|jgi:hypothetical protein|nr:hypothetical protein [Acidobacteriota bacterium]